MDKKARIFMALVQDTDLSPTYFALVDGVFYPCSTYATAVSMGQTIVDGSTEYGGGPLERYGYTADMVVEVVPYTEPAA